MIIASPGNSSLGYGGNTYNYGPASDEVIAFRDRVQAVMTNDSGLTMPDLVVRYPFDFFGDSVAAVISGPASEAQVDSTIASYHAQVPPVVWEKLRAYSLLNPRLLRGDEVVRDGTMRT